MKHRSKSADRGPAGIELIEQEIKTILVGSFKITEEQIAPGTKIHRDLGLDEFQQIEFAGELEARFNVVVDADRFGKTETLRQLAQYLKSIGALA